MNCRIIRSGKRIVLWLSYRRLRPRAIAGNTTNGCMNKGGFGMQSIFDSREYQMSYQANNAPSSHRGILLEVEATYMLGKEVCCIIEAR